ncbi:MAG: hypothetical protein P8R54_18630 [Myxococcota bacterium]|nr:hypothetical protein [Myxococcota bacterium]
MIWMLISPALAQTVEPPPAPRYLQDAEIHTVLRETDWQQCVGAGTADLTAPVSFRIMPSGDVEIITVGAPDPLAPCWSELLSALQFREHDEEPLVLLWTLGIHDSVAIPYPAFTAERRQLHPFYLFIPPDASPEAVKELLEVFEVTD